MGKIFAYNIRNAESTGALQSSIFFELRNYQALLCWFWIMHYKSHLGRHEEVLQSDFLKIIFKLRWWTWLQHKNYWLLTKGIIPDFYSRRSITVHMHLQLFVGSRNMTVKNIGQGCTNPTQLLTNMREKLFKLCWHLTISHQL